MENGDLIIKVKIEDSLKFKRNNNDIEIKIDITLSDALFGCDKLVETLDGEEAIINIKGGIQNGEKIKIMNKVLFINLKGFYLSENISNKSRGDQIVYVNIKIPNCNKLSRHDQDQIKNILDKLII